MHIDDQESIKLCNIAYQNDRIFKGYHDQKKKIGWGCYCYHGNRKTENFVHFLGYYGSKTINYSAFLILPSKRTCFLAYFEPLFDFLQ